MSHVLVTRLVDSLVSYQPVDSSWATDFNAKSTSQKEDIIRHSVKKCVGQNASKLSVTAFDQLVKVYTVESTRKVIESTKKMQKTAEYFLEKTHDESSLSKMKMPMAFATVITIKIEEKLPSFAVVPFSLFFRCVSLVLMWWPFRIGTEMFIPTKAEMTFAEASLINAYHRVIAFIETIFNTVGLSELFALSDNQFEDDQKGYRVMALFQFFISLPATLPSVFKLDEGLGKNLGYAILSVLLLSLIYPFIQPTPSRLPRGENLSEKIRFGLDVKEGRRDYVERITEALETGKKVMIVGKSGIGKTETVFAFSQAVTEGRIPSLKGKEVFYFNTANFVDDGWMGNGNIVRQVVKKIGKNKENVIVIFDELQEACKKGKRELLAQQLKTMLDKGCNSFPNFVGITTDEEYERDVMEQGAFSRRFETIFIDKPDFSEMIKILADTMLQEAPEVFLQDDQITLKYIVEKSRERIPELGQISISVDPALEVLQECLKRTSDTQ